MVKLRFEAFFRFSFFVQNGKQMKRAISFEKEHLPVFVMFAYSRRKEGMKFVQHLDRTKNASIDTSESSSVRVRGNRDIQTTLHKSSLSFQQTEYFIA